MDHGTTAPQQTVTGHHACYLALSLDINGNHLSLSRCLKLTAAKTTVMTEKDVQGSCETSTETETEKQVTLSRGSAYSRNHETTAWPLSWKATVRLSSGVMT